MVSDPFAPEYATRASICMMQRKKDINSRFPFAVIDCRNEHVANTTHKDLKNLPIQILEMLAEPATSENFNQSEKYT